MRFSHLVAETNPKDPTSRRGKPRASGRFAVHPYDDHASQPSSRSYVVAHVCTVQEYENRPTPGPRRRVHQFGGDPSQRAVLT